jgi:predicted  nucleic acid-binding Zn-ribbon protein
MNQRTTGLVVGLVIFVILTVGLLASTIYFNIEMNDAKVKAKESSDTARAAQAKEGKIKTAYGSLTSFVTGDPSQSADSPVEDIKKSLGAENVTSLKIELETLRSRTEQLSQDNANLKKQMAASQSDATASRDEAKKATEGAQAASKRVEGDIATYRTSSQKFGDEVKDTVATVKKYQDDMDQRHRNEMADLQGQIDNVSSSRAELSGKVEVLQKTVDQYRVKPENAASLADGRVIDVTGQNSEIFISIGSKQRVQPGMTFDVYDSANAIQYNPTTGDLIPGKARVQVLKVEENTSTARVIPENTRYAPRPRPIVKDDVIANVIFSPDYRYKFLVHGKFDIDNDGTATAAESEFVRGRIKSWGGDVVEGDTLRGDLDFIVMGVQPLRPLDLSSDADEGQYTSHFEQKKAYETYQTLFTEAQTARVPVLNWNRMQVLTNEGR